MKVLVIGGRGLLGRFLLEALGSEGRGYDLPDLDVTSPDRVAECVGSEEPDWIVNCAAVTDVDLCEREPGLALAVNRDGVRNLVATGARLLTVSTDQVFSTADPVPQLEDASPSPVNVYARSKLAGEAAALSDPANAVVRTSWLFGSGRGMVPSFRGRLASGGTVEAVTDQVSCLTYAADLAEAVVSIVRSGGSGIFHLVNTGAMTPFDIASGLREMTGRGEVRPVTWEELAVDARRPACSVLGTSRGILLPPAWDAVERWMDRNV